MAITVPIAGQEISASTFGIPVANEVNALTPELPKLKLTGGQWRGANPVALANATNLVVPWAFEDYDTDGFMPVGGTTVIIPAGLDGIYVASAFGTVGAPGHIFIGYGAQRWLGPSDSMFGVAHCSCVLRLTAGNQIYVQARQASGASVNVADFTFNMWRMRGL